MKILAVDTSSGVASVALTDDEKLKGEFVLYHKKTHSQMLMPAIEKLLKICQTDICDIDLFAAAAGPGSFTGLRIGIATIKALAHATNKPVAGVSTLKAMAYNLAYCSTLIAPIMDARRSQVYSGIYRWEGTNLSTVAKPQALAIERLLDMLLEHGGQVVFIGDGVPVHKDIIVNKLGERALFAPVNANMQKASCVAALARYEASKGNVCRYNELLPVYLRKSQAEREYEEKQQAQAAAVTLPDGELK